MGTLISPILVFVAALIIAFSFVVHLNLAYARQIKTIRRIYASAGKAWDYWSNTELRLKMLRDPEAIFEKDDSPELRSAKADLVVLRRRMRKFVPIGIAIFAVGFISCILAAIVETWIRELIRR